MDEQTRAKFRCLEDYCYLHGLGLEVGERRGVVGTDPRSGRRARQDLWVGVVRDRRGRVIARSVRPDALAVRQDLCLQFGVEPGDLRLRGGA